jgi:hypothetical protein
MFLMLHSSLSMMTKRTSPKDPGSPAPCYKKVYSLLGYQGVLSFQDLLGLLSHMKDTLLEV